VAQTSASHNLPTNRARELIKPSTDFAGLRLEIEKKNFFGLDFGFFVCYVPMRTSLCIFVAFTWLWEPAQCELFSLKVLLYLWLKNESLEPLIDLLAYLDRKLWLKNPVFGKNLKFSKKVTLATFVQLWPLVVCSQIELESYSNPLKTREVVYIRIKKNFQNFFGPWPHDWRMFCEYSYEVIRGSNARILWLKVLLDPGLECEFLDPLIDFLAFLVPKSGQKHPNTLPIC